MIRKKQSIPSQVWSIQSDSFYDVYLNRHPNPAIDVVASGDVTFAKLEIKPLPVASTGTASALFSQGTVHNTPSTGINAGPGYGGPDVTIQTAAPLDRPSV
ncbi:hypothetical protein B7494_g7545 [Chlorociboria aeruginascens]|nr:hypothetical protein B7494_g7545 [Chlorociboria aeruginascens]